jgi:hypothetical protein
MESINYNYFKFIAPDGDVAGVGAAEKGSDNELMIIEGCMELGFTLEVSTREEYEAFDGDEIKNH